MTDQTISAPEAAPSDVVSRETTAPEAASTPPVEGAGKDQPADEQPAEGEDQEQKKPRQKASERIGEIYGRMKQAERERDIALSELSRLRQPVVDPNQWDQLSYDQQQQAQLRHAVRQERAAEIEAEVNAREMEAERHRGTMFMERMNQFQERVPEAKAVLEDPTLPVSTIGARFISESDKGPEVAWWLHQNRTEAHRISRLDPVSQAFELGRIEARISAAPAARKVSQAPAPVPKVGGGANAGVKDPANMSMEEYASWYKSRR